MSNPESPEAHEGHIVLGNIRNADAPATVGLLTLKFVHYPGAQQLILWLPQSGYHGYGDLVLTRDSAVIDRATVRDRLNGSVQILFDTLPWPRGDYAITITHADGWRHEAELQKLEAGIAPPQPEPPPPEPVSDAPIVYRDGFGKLIPNLDLDIRARVQQEVARQFARRIEYEGTLRGGSVIYIDGDRRLSFDNELCGGAMKCTIYVPSAEHWLAATGVPLAERDEIIAYVAQRVQREQASSWRYEITSNSIDFY